MILRKPWCALAMMASLASPLAAHAADQPEQEFRTLARCSFAIRLYDVVVVQKAWPGATAADKILAARANAATRAIDARAVALLTVVGKEKGGAILDETSAAGKARLRELQGDRNAANRAALDLYSPIVEACILGAS